MSSQTVAAIQARLGSSRLPGKVLLKIDERPMLQWVIERARCAALVDRVIVLTSNASQDDAIVDFARSQGVDVRRGSERDVLSRYAEGLSDFTSETDVVVRLTADCPLLDPDVIDQTIRVLENDKSVGYAATRMPDERTFPVGIDVEAFRGRLLQHAHVEASEPYQREHVTPWFYDGSYRGKIVHVTADEPCGDLRWTVDTPEDLEFLRALSPLITSHDWRSVLSVIRSHPELSSINAKVKQKSHLEVER